jgi:chromosome segregation ATPase
MVKKLIGLSMMLGCMGVLPFQSYGADAALSYLKSAGTPPTLSAKDCAQVCKDVTCAADLNAKNYRCFKGCAQNLAVFQIMKCTNQQFTHYIQDLHAQINDLMGITKNQAQRLTALQYQMSQAQQTLDQNRRMLADRAAMNAELQRQFTDLQNRFKRDQDRLRTLFEINARLTLQLGEAQRTISQQALNIDALKATIAANEGEIAALKAELDGDEKLLLSLMERVRKFIEQVGSVIDMFDKSALEVNTKRKEFETVIKEFEKLLDSHEKEFLPFMREREAEFNQLINDMNSDLERSKKFIQRLQTLMNETRQMYEVASSAYK